MKRISYLTLAALLMGLAVGAWAQEVSLGEYARKQREQQKPASPTTKVFTNDDIASSSSSPAPSASAASDASTDSDKDKKSAKSKDKEQTKAEEMNKAAEEFKGKVADQKQKIAEIQRNIDVSNREFKLHTIDWYTQAGNALLDPKKYKDETDKHDKEIADLQKQLADAQAELDKIRDEIKKAGLSSSLGD